jgi:hypothetical protein
MTKRPFTSILLALAVGLAVAAPPAHAGDRDTAGVRGFVDGSAIGRLAGEDSELVEIHLGPALLGAIARGAKDDPDAAALLGGLRSVSAYIVGLDGDADRTAKATKLFGALEEQLLRDGWERLARVREKGDRVNVFVLGNGGTVEGLVVLVLDKDEGKVVFANLAGNLDLAKLGNLKEALDVPGLDQVDVGGRPEGTAPKKKDGAPPDSRPKEEAP